MVPVKKLIIAVGLFVFLSPSYMWSGPYKVITLYEQKFDIPIKDIVLDSYQKDGVLKFYPKIVCFARCDSTRYGLMVTGAKEIRILGLKGKVIKKMDCNVGDKFGYSRKRNYFYIYRSKPIEGEECGYLGVLEVYNDKGKLLWKKDSLQELDEGSSHTFYLSSRDGSAIIQTTYSYNDESSFELYDSAGNMHKLELAEREKSSLKFDFSDNMEYFVSLSMKFPDKLPFEYSEPTIVFLDSMGKVLWRKNLKVNMLDTSEPGDHFISSQGTYAYAAGYNANKPVKHIGYIFNKQGNLIMEILEGSMPIGFSSDEKYMLIKISSSKITDRLDWYEPGSMRIALIDIENKKILFNKGVGLTGYPDTDYGDAAVVSPDGKVAYIEEVITKTNEDPQDFQWKKIVKVIDKNGNEVYESDPLLSIGNGIVFGRMEWHGSNMVYYSIDETRKTLQIKSVLFTE